MSKPIILYGWRVSYFTRRILCYFRYKKLNFVEVFPNAIQIRYTLKKKVGVSVMPIVETPEGQFLQDSRHIIDEFEKKFPDRPVFPDLHKQPKRYVVACLFEAWTDELWLGPAMYYRWGFPERNWPAFTDEVSHNMFPWFFVPRFLAHKAVDKVASVLRRFVPMTGVRGEQTAVAEKWQADVLDLLDRHFEKSTYLLGEAATIADFGLAGPVIAHLAYDPYPAETLIAPRKHLKRWVDTMQSVNPPDAGSVSAEDTIPATLEPLLRMMLNEYPPLLQQTADTVAKIEAEYRAAKKAIPRVMTKVETDSPFGDTAFYKRATMPFMLWKAQSLREAVRTMSGDQQAAVRSYLTSLHPVGGAAWMDLKAPKLVRVGLRVKFA